jgi:hypothetical protein
MSCNFLITTRVIIFDTVPGYLTIFLKLFLIQVNSTVSARVQVEYFTVYMTCGEGKCRCPSTICDHMPLKTKDFLGVYPVVEQVHDFLVVGQTPSFLVAGVLLKEEQWVFLGDHPVVVLDLSFLALRISCYCF